MSLFVIMSFAERPLLYATVMMTGAAIMILELLGSRIIAPFYGTSLPVWSSLISITLLALASGYYLGGWISDNLERFRLSYVIALAAFSIAMIPPSSNPILSMTNSLGVRGGALMSAFLLFTIPLTFLGMVCPHVVKQSTRSLKGLGVVSGSIYALSTLGSVIGTVLLGFFLFPTFGSKTILYCISGSFFLLALIIALHEREQLEISLPPLIVGFLLVLCTLMVILISSIASADQAQQIFKTLYKTESLYGEVRVIDEPARNVRWMFSDASMLSAISLVSNKSMLSEHTLSEALSYVKPKAKTALLIGLGGGHIVDSFNTRGLITDVIEINPAVVFAAKQYFSFKPSGNLFIGDARYQIRQLTHNYYDLIIHDGFTGRGEPKHLLSIEALTELKTKLKTDGILAIHFVGFTQGPEAQVTTALLRTITEAFRYTRSYITVPGLDFNNFVFYASDQPILQSDIDERILAWLSKRELNLNPQDSFVITDDFNPLDSMQIRKAEAYRQKLLERVGTQLLL